MFIYFIDNASIYSAYKLLLRQGKLIQKSILFIFILKKIWFYSFIINKKQIKLWGTWYNELFFFFLLSSFLIVDNNCQAKNGMGRNREQNLGRNLRCSHFILNLSFFVKFCQFLLISIPSYLLLIPFHSLSASRFFIPVFSNEGTYSSFPISFYSYTSQFLS